MSVTQQLARMQGEPGAPVASPSPVLDAGEAEQAMQRIRRVLEGEPIPEVYPTDAAHVARACYDDDVHLVLAALAQARAQSQEQAEYAIALQRMIEAICAGEIPDDLAAQSPHLAQRAREHLAQARADSELLDFIQSLGAFVRYEVDSDEFAIYNGYDMPMHELGRGETLRDALNTARCAPIPATTAAPGAADLNQVHGDHA